MTETNEALLRALERSAHERMAGLLQSSEAADVPLTFGASDSRTVAVLARLEQCAERLMRQAYDLYERTAFREDEMEVVVPRHDLPWPDVMPRWRGIPVVVGNVDDVYHVRPQRVVR